MADECQLPYERDAALAEFIKIYGLRSAFVTTMERIKTTTSRQEPAEKRRGQNATTGRMLRELYEVVCNDPLSDAAIEAVEYHSDHSESKYPGYVWINWNDLVEFVEKRKRG